MIELKNISKKYGSTLAIKEVSLALPQGQIVGLFGENGAGKTTLLKCILGLLPYEGTITLDGAPVTEKNIERLSFATCEHSFFPALSPKAHRDFYQAHFPRFNDRRFQALMKFFGLPMEKQLRAFSAGMKNQFEVIMALSQGADYILMDEPFAALDLPAKQDALQFMQYYLSLGNSIIVASHEEAVFQFCHKVYLLKNGGLIDTSQMTGTITNYIDLLRNEKES